MRAWAGAAAVASLLALLSAVALDRLAGDPAADVARGSEDAFVAGLYPRELVAAESGRRPLRWSGERVLVRFRNVPAGTRRIDVALRGHRQPVAVFVDGALVGSLAPAASRLELALPASRRTQVSVELRSETFVAGDGRRLGMQFGRVRLEHERAGPPPWGLLLAALATGLGSLAAAAAAGFAPAVGVAACAALLAVQGALLLPCGLARSDYALALPALLVLGCAAAAAFARWLSTLGAAPATAQTDARWTFAALLLAIAAAVVWTSPMVVMSDAVFHGNKLRQVAGGDFFPVSRTQHAVPFRFPYGASFYALLVPLARAGFDPVALVRGGAGLAAVAGALALLLLARGAPGRAALALLLLVAMPISGDVFSYGNLSNIFGQAVLLAFVAWWVTPRGGAVVGAALLALSAVAHLSCALVAAVLVPLLLLLERALPIQSTASSGRTPPIEAMAGVEDPLRIAQPSRSGRTLLVAVLAGSALAALYYSRFVPLVLEQLPRLAEGGGSGRQSISMLQGLAQQALNAAGQWGWPALLLALAGLPRPSRGVLDRTLAAVWCAGGLLAALAAVSPLEVRYAYAMSFAVALAAAAGTRRLAARGRLAAGAAGLLLAAQLALALRATVEIVLQRYRP